MCMAHWGIDAQLGPRRKSTGGFTVLEFVIALSITAILLATGLPACRQVLSHAELESTTRRLVWTMRLAQADAGTNGGQSMIELSRYTPYYFVYLNAKLAQVVRFQPGVNYVDGYLQMPSSRISYTAHGDSMVGGVIRLRAGKDRESIQLYIQSGLQMQGNAP